MGEAFDVGQCAVQLGRVGVVRVQSRVGADESSCRGGYATQALDGREQLLPGRVSRGHAREEELRSPDLELNQLISIEDVTRRVQAAVPSGMTAADAAAARRAVMAEIEKESLEQTGLRSDVVTLYGGGRYHLYRYKKYTDVRLVWAPEAAMAFLGGDADNFEYPRYNLDACLFRVYENGEPARTEHFLKWSDRGAEENQLVFVSGNPGRTNRMSTVAELKYLRDISLALSAQLHPSP